MDLARAPRRRPLTARKKGSGYENGILCTFYLRWLPRVLFPGVRSSYICKLKLVRLQNTNERGVFI